MQNIATPGIGSLKAGWIFTGVCQLSLAIVSCVLVCSWVIGWSYRIYLAQNDEVIPQDSSGWLLKWGIIFFSGSWLWAMVTCVSLVRRATMAERQTTQKVPPRLANSPGKPPKLL
jgi:hypothetical protein